MLVFVSDNLQLANEQHALKLSKGVAIVRNGAFVSGHNSSRLLLLSFAKKASGGDGDEEDED